MIKEQFAYSDYEVCTRKKSQIDKGRSIRVIKGFDCPQCKTLLPTLEHLSSEKCENCGLGMTRRGNSLECTK